MTAAIFYRIVPTGTPTELYFTSYRAQGRILRHPTAELLDRWAGISVYESEGQARHWARKRPYLGAFIAELRINEGIRREQTGRSGHYTLWGDPESLLRSMVRVVVV